MKVPGRSHYCFGQAGNSKFLDKTVKDLYKSLGSSGDICTRIRGRDRSGGDVGFPLQVSGHSEGESMNVGRYAKVGPLGFCIAALVVFAMVLPSGAGADPKAHLATIGSSGSLGGQFTQARGIAVNHDTGDFYVADGGNARIQQFSASGSFIRAWGTDVIASGKPGDTGTGFEICNAVPGPTPGENCKAGTTTLGAAGQVAQPMGVAVDQATGYVYVTSNTNRRVDIFSSNGVFAGAFGWGVDTGVGALELCTTLSTCQQGVAGAGAGQFPTSLIASSPAIDPSAPPGTVYVPEQGNARVSKFATTITSGALSSVSFIKAFGWDVAPGAVSEEQEIRIRATGGQFKLSFESDTTPDLSFDATSGEVQAALNALSSISGGGGSVSVSGGPGDAGGTSPYVIRFDGGPLAGVNILQELVASNGTAPLVGTGASVLTRANGGTTTELESCTVASGCKAGSAGGGSGQFTGGTPAASAGSPSSAAVDSTGAIYVVSGPFNNAANDCTAAAPCRIQKFNSSTTAAVDFGPASGPGQITNTTSLDAGNVAGLDVAVDPDTDRVFVNLKSSSTTYQVREYDSAGGLIETHPPNALTSVALTNNHGLAVGTEDRVYSNLMATSVYILGPVPDPVPTMGVVGNVTATTADLEGAVDIPSPGSPTFTTGFHFEYSKNGEDWEDVTADQHPGDGSTGTHPVADIAAGLQPNTTYQARMVATTGGDDVFSEKVTFTTEEAPPAIARSYVEEVTETSAELGAHIDPQGLPTKYHFEWATQAEWEATEEYPHRAPAFDRQLGGGNEVVIVREEIDGLQPASVYRFRVVATNAKEEVAGPAVRFETLNECGLLENRCYELVSPSDKGPVASAGDSAVLGNRLQFQAAADGPAIAYNLAFGLPSATAGGEVLYQGERNSTGWAASQVDPPSLVVPGMSPPSAANSNPTFPLGLSEDLGCYVFNSNQPLTTDTPAATLEQGKGVVHLRKDGVLRTVTTIPASNGDSVFRDFINQYLFVGMAEAGADRCERVILRSEFHYPGASGQGAWRSYEWSRGELRSVGIVPGPGGLEEAEVVPGSPENFNSLPAAGFEVHNFRNAVSLDGRRLFFTAVSRVGGDTGAKAVFVRELKGEAVGDVAAGSAIVQGLEPGDGQLLPGQAVYGAGIPAMTTIVSVDTNAGELTLSNPATKSGVAVRLEAFTATDVSQSQNPGVTNTGNSRYEVASRDGRYVFFTARRGLDPDGESGGPASCTLGFGDPNGPGCSLYQYDVEAGELVDLSIPQPDTTNSNGPGVAGVLDASEDGSHVYFAARGQLIPEAGRTEAENIAESTYSIYLWTGGGLKYVGSIGTFEAENTALTASSMKGIAPRFTTRVTPDGSYLLYQSSTDSADFTGEGRREAFLYSEQAEQTMCLSCRRDGLASVADPTFNPLMANGEIENRTKPPTTLVENEDGGATVFFRSPNRLAVGATEGRLSLYQWKDGQIAFLASSAPSAARELTFAGASRDGQDVYFTTVDQLTWQDTDGKLDVYDARVGGGFSQPPAPPQACNPLVEASCQGSGLVSPPASTVPGSAALQGPGNVQPAPEKAKKKKVKKKKKARKKGQGKRRSGRQATKNGRAGL